MDERASLTDQQLAAEIHRRAGAGTLGSGWAESEVYPVLDSVTAGTSPQSGLAGRLGWVAGLGAATIALILVAVAIAGWPTGKPTLTSSSSAVPGATAASDEVIARDTQGDFTLTMKAGRPSYASEQPIPDIQATLAYAGPEESVRLSGVLSLINGFALEQLDGPHDLDGGWPVPCAPHVLVRDQPLVEPFSKSGGFSNDDPLAAWYREFFADPELRLPPGTWKITAYSDFLVGHGCEGERVTLEASIVITTLPSAEPTSIATPQPTPPPQIASPEPTPNRAATIECSDYPDEDWLWTGHATIIDETGLVESCETVVPTHPTMPVTVFNPPGEPNVLRVTWTAGPCAGYVFRFVGVGDSYAIDGEPDTTCYFASLRSHEFRLHLREALDASRIAITLRGAPQITPHFGCPWEPTGTASVDGFDPDNRNPFCDSNGASIGDRLNLIPRAPRHCGWESVALLHAGWPIGSVYDGYSPVQFVRDPANALTGWHVPEFQTVKSLPEGAADTGFTNGNVRIFVSDKEGDAAIYAVMGSVIERWPRAPEVIACR